MTEIGDRRTELERQVDEIASGRQSQIPKPDSQMGQQGYPLLQRGDDNIVTEIEEESAPEVIQKQRESILNMPSALPKKSGRRKRGLRNRLVAGTLGAGLGTMVHLVKTGIIQKWIGGSHAELFRKQQDVINQGEKTTQNLVRQAQKEGVDFGESFDLGKAKTEGAQFFGNANTAIKGVLVYDSTHPELGSKADFLLDKAITQDPLTFEPGVGAVHYDSIFNSQNWSIGEQLYFAALENVAKEQGISPDGGGLEIWLINHGKDTIVTVNEQQIHSAHLIQILWNEYKSNDNLPILPTDQQLLKDYWQNTGRNWISLEWKIDGLQKTAAHIRPGKEKWMHEVHISKEHAVSYSHKFEKVQECVDTYSHGAANQLLGPMETMCLMPIDRSEMHEAIAADVVDLYHDHSAKPLLSNINPLPFILTGLLLLRVGPTWPRAIIAEASERLEKVYYWVKFGEAERAIRDLTILGKQAWDRVRGREEKF